MEVLPYELRLYVYEIYRRGIRKRQLERILRFPVRQRSCIYDYNTDFQMFVIGLREDHFRWEFIHDGGSRGRKTLWVNGKRISAGETVQNWRIAGRFFPL
jgi:hypothetical protein